MTYADDASRYRAQAARHARVLEELARAILSGEVTPAEVRDDVATHARARDVATAAASVADLRAGGAPWSWPTRAPWRGF